MKTAFRPMAMIGALLICLSGLQGFAASPVNTLTPEEKQAGWQLLFDGQTTRGWRGFKKSTFPDKGWLVEDGWLKKVPGVQGGDIVTEETFAEFELQWEWRVAARANSGVKYFITEERSGAIGHEYQMMDEPEAKLGKHSTASFYDVLTPTVPPPARPAGQVNHSRIVVQGNHVEHWLNSVKVLEYDLGSPEVRAAVAQSKFKNVPGFGTKLKGHILVTDHKDEAWFRNVKIRSAAQK